MHPLVNRWGTAQGSKDTYSLVDNTTLHRDAGKQFILFSNNIGVKNELVEGVVTREVGNLFQYYTIRIEKDIDEGPLQPYRIETGVEAKAFFKKLLYVDGNNQPVVARHHKENGGDVLWVMSPTTGFADLFCQLISGGKSTYCPLGKWLHRLLYDWPLYLKLKASPFAGSLSATDVGQEGTVSGKLCTESLGVSDDSWRRLAT